MGNPSVSAEWLCVGCRLASSDCTCRRLAGRFQAAQHVAVCRCGRFTIPPQLRGFAELANVAARQSLAEGERLVRALAGVPDAARQGLAEGEQLVLALPGVPEPLLVEPSGELCSCGRKLKSWTEPACSGCSRQPGDCTCEALAPVPRRVCRDCAFNDGRIAAVAAHVRETHHRIDLALVESARSGARQAEAASPFHAGLGLAVDVAEEGATILRELAELTAPPNVGGPVFAVLLADAVARAVRQREILKSLLSVLENPGARIVLEGGRPVVHLAETVSVEELGAVELDGGEGLEKTQIRPVPASASGDEPPLHAGVADALNLDTWTETRSVVCGSCGRAVAARGSGVAECGLCQQLPALCTCKPLPGWQVLVEVANG